MRTSVNRVVVLPRNHERQKNWIVVMRKEEKEREASDDNIVAERISIAHSFEKSRCATAVESFIINTEAQFRLHELPGTD